MPPATRNWPTIERKIYFYRATPDSSEILSQIVREEVAAEVRAAFDRK